MFRRLIPAALAAIALAAGPSGPAWAQDTIVGVQQFLGAGEATETMARNLGAMVESALVRAISDRGCPAEVVTLDPEMIAKVLKEIELQQSGAVDPATAVAPDPLVANTLVQGVVSQSGAELIYFVEIVSTDGRRLAETSGIHRASDQFGLADRIAGEIAASLCPARSWHLRADYNDLVLDGPVCDITKPFSVPGQGQTAGIVFSFTPTAVGQGTFTLSGTAGGVPWTGGGTYQISTHSMLETGSMVMQGAWQLTSPVGTFGDQATIYAKLTRITCP